MATSIRIIAATHPGTDGQLEELVVHLVRSGRLSHPEAARLIDEVLSFLSETAEQFICRRHHELQREGYANREIFNRISQELARRPFRVPVLSERQIRRIVYG